MPNPGDRVRVPSELRPEPGVRTGLRPRDRPGEAGGRAGTRRRASLLARGRISACREEVTAITDSVDADAKVLEEKAEKIERHGSETAKLFKTRYFGTRGLSRNARLLTLSRTTGHQTQT